MGHNRFDWISCLESFPQIFIEPQAMEGEGFLQPLFQAGGLAEKLNMAELGTKKLHAISGANG
jgi:hypothetical protein